MQPLIRFILRITLTSIIGFISISYSDENNIPEPFRGESPNSVYKITYDDLNNLYRSSVLPIGRSTREMAESPKASVGTRLRPKVNRLTSLESNRFLFESYGSEKHRQIIKNIRLSLQTVPDELPLSDFKKEEQLAYWLNLYNIALLESLVQIYPKRSLKNYFRQNDSFFFEKNITVAGIKLSLNDIQNTILWEKFNGNPLIIYGLYQGIVGGPNLRPAAYQGKSVFNELKDNAQEFVNSNRGTFSNDEDDFRISSLYQRNKRYFPNFYTDIRRHLVTFLNLDYADTLRNSKNISADINDWSFSDMFGTVSQVGSSVSTNSAALLDSTGAPEITGFVQHFDGVNLNVEPTGVMPGGDDGNSGWASPTRGMDSANNAARANRGAGLTSQQIKALRRLQQQFKMNQGEVILTREKDADDSVPQPPLTSTKEEPETDH